ncbi:MAG TPA: AMP-binding protein [Ktedonobacterales bacterium]|nr:AMP-binding protein [Ktedonobacterales bacterium]
MNRAFPANATSVVGNLADILCEQARRLPAQPAIIDTHHGRTRVITFAMLEHRVGQAAALLWQAGLRPGDTVLVLQPMSAELYIALIAIFRSGLTAMFVDPSAGSAQVERCCAQVHPQGFIGSARAHLLRPLVPSVERIPRKFVIGAWLPGAIPWSRAEVLAPREQVAARVPDSPALLTFTSGSTGQPSAMSRSHRFLLAQHTVLQRNLAPDSDAGGDVSMTGLPIFVLADLAAGATSLLPPGNLRKPGEIDPAPVVAQILRYQPRRAGASPAFWERIATWCHQRRVVLPSLEKIYTGGAPVFPRLLDDLHACAPWAQIVAVYGSTEAEPIAHIARGDFLPGDIPAMQSGAGLLAGEPIPEVALRILPDRWGTPLSAYTHDEFEATCLPAGQPGEIVVSGAHVGTGYVGGIGDGETKIHVGETIWHRTGDAGYLDAHGRLWLLGRCFARIDDARGTLYPFTVEAAASAHPAIRRSAMVAWRGQRLLLVEQAYPLHGGERDILKQSLAWACLDAIRVVSRIPVDRRHNSKVDYPALMRLLERMR